MTQDTGVTVCGPQLEVAMQSSYLDGAKSIECENDRTNYPSIAIQNICCMTFHLKSGKPIRETNLWKQQDIAERNLAGRN